MTLRHSQVKVIWYALSITITFTDTNMSTSIKSIWSLHCHSHQSVNLLPNTTYNHSWLITVMPILYWLSYQPFVNVESSLCITVKLSWQWCKMAIIENHYHITVFMACNHTLSYQSLSTSMCHCHQACHGVHNYHHHHNTIKISSQSISSSTLVDCVSLSLSIGWVEEPNTSTNLVCQHWSCHTVTR